MLHFPLAYLNQSTRSFDSSPPDKLMKKHIHTSIDLVDRSHTCKNPFSLPAVKPATPVAGEMSGRRPDGSYGPEYGPQPPEHEHGLYHHWPSRGRAPWPLYHGRDYHWRPLEQRVRREPFVFSSRIHHINGGGNPRPRQENHALTDAEFKKAMEQLKKQAYRSSRGGRDHAKSARSEPAPNNMEEEKACTICLETFIAGEQVVATPCNHIFHQGCITPWVKGHGNCPVCRLTLCERNAVSDNSQSGVGGVEVDLDLLEMMRAMEEIFSRVTFSNFMPYH